MDRLTVDETYVVLALLMPVGILEKYIQKCCYSKDHLSYTPFFLAALPVEQFELVKIFLHISDNLACNEQKGSTKLSKFT